MILRCDLENKDKSVSVQGDGENYHENDDICEWVCGKHNVQNVRSEQTPAYLAGHHHSSSPREREREGSVALLFKANPLLSCPISDSY